MSEKQTSSTDTLSPDTSFSGNLNGLAQQTLVVEAPESRENVSGSLLTDIDTGQQPLKWPTDQDKSPKPVKPITWPVDHEKRAPMEYTDGSDQATSDTGTFKGSLIEEPEETGPQANAAETTGRHRRLANQETVQFALPKGDEPDRPKHASRESASDALQSPDDEWNRLQAALDDTSTYDQSTGVQPTLEETTPLIEGQLQPLLSTEPESIEWPPEENSQPKSEVWPTDANTAAIAYQDEQWKGLREDQRLRFGIAENTPQPIKDTRSEDELIAADKHAFTDRVLSWKEKASDLAARTGKKLKHNKLTEKLSIVDDNGEYTDRGKKVVTAIGVLAGSAMVVGKAYLQFKGLADMNKISSLAENYQDNAGTGSTYVPGANILDHSTADTQAVPTETPTPTTPTPSPVPTGPNDDSELPLGPPRGVEHAEVAIPDKIALGQDENPWQRIQQLMPADASAKQIDNATRIALAANNIPYEAARNLFVGTELDLTSIKDLLTTKS